MTDFRALLRHLVEADVRFILVAGFAATVLGSPRVTIDLDVVYDRARGNLERLVSALHPLSPKDLEAIAELELLQREQDHRGSNGA